MTRAENPSRSVTVLPKESPIEARLVPEDAYTAGYFWLTQVDDSKIEAKVVPSDCRSLPIDLDVFFAAAMRDRDHDADADQYRDSDLPISLTTLPM
jgi:hypothetical protein